MKITHALRSDSRWDTYRQSRLRSRQRTFRDDTIGQVEDMYTDEPVNEEDTMDEESWLAWGQDEWRNWWDYQSSRS
jgi:hypothetical protein